MVEQNDNKSVNILEAQFLASQQARLSHIARSNANGDSDENDNAQAHRKSFWSAFKQACTSIDSSLNALDAKSYVTAQQRNEALSGLQGITSLIRALHHYTVHSKSSVWKDLMNRNNSTLSTSNNEINDGKESFMEQFQSNAMPELPLADQRLVSTELQRLKDKATNIQSTIMPKEKFSFRRYRAELMNRKKIHSDALDKDEGSEVDDVHVPDRDEQKDEKGSSKALHEQFEGRFLSEMYDLSLIVDSIGNVSKSAFQNEEIYHEDELDIDREEPKSYLVQNLTHCNVLLKGSYESLHIIGAKDSIIRVPNPIHGPVHVTNCHNTKIVIAFSRQLRIHDCTSVGFYIHVGSGPIIEACKEMKFYQRDCQICLKEGKNLYWDVKDFHWLKNNVKSPNFEVISQQKQHDMIRQSALHTQDIVENAKEEEDEAADESSDDEL